MTAATAESLDPPALPRKLAAEVIGTFVLVFFGCGAAMASGADIVATSLAFGISVLVMAFAVGHISGGHFNPAVSVGAAVAGRIAWIDAAFYIVAQLVGALLAGLVLFITWKGFDGFSAEGNMGQNSFGDEGSGIAMWAALVIEIIGTLVFLWIILAATDQRNKAIASAAPFAIGFALTGLHLVMIPLTGTSVNPARSIGVGVFAGTDAIIQLWLFIVAPLVGAAIAGVTYAFVFGRDGMAVVGGGLNFGGGGKSPQAAAWGQPVWDPNTGQWVQPGQPPAQQWAQSEQQQQWAQPEQQQWAPPAEQQQWAPPAEQQWQQPQQPAQEQWGQQPQQPPAQEQQWQQPPAPEQQQWAPPAEGTQIRPNDPQQ